MFGWFRRRRAERRYYTLDQQAYDVRERLFIAPCAPVDRVRALGEMAAIERAMVSELHVFEDPEDRDERGFNLMESGTAAAALLDLVAETEVAAFGMNSTPLALRCARWAQTAPTSRAAAVLGLLAVETRPAARARLTDQLHIAVVDRVGGQAAEVLTLIAEMYRHRPGVTQPGSGEGQQR